MKYAYPAIFTKEGESYLVNFPDIECCHTFGDSIADALEMANDVLSLMLCEMEDENRTINPPTDVKALKTDENSFVTMVACDTTEYRKLYDNKAVKKTLTIPNWLNTLAEKADINFSQLLQEALKARLNL